MKRWLARLAFSFLIIAGVLVYEAYRAMNDDQQEIQIWRIALYIAGAAALAVLGMIGVRLRHRPENTDESDHRSE